MKRLFVKRTLNFLFGFPRVDTLFTLLRVALLFHDFISRPAARLLVLRVFPVGRFQQKYSPKNFEIRTEAAIKNGTSFKSNADILKAELLKADQRAIEMKSLRNAYIDMLGFFINQSLNENTVLESPIVVNFQEATNINRPELMLYNSQASLLGAQYKSLHTRNLPKFSLFLQSGYGRPGLNALLNEFAGYYIGGLRFNWNLSGFYNTHRDKQLLDLNVQQLNYQKETFLFNTNLQLKQQSQEVKKLAELIDVDDKIIELRTNVSTTAKAQHENGVISTNDLLRELNAEDQAKQNRLLHQVQLMLARYAYQNISGN